MDGSQFDMTVAVSADGKYALIGARGSGSSDDKVYVYEMVAGEWQMAATFTGPAGKRGYGDSLAINSDGTYAVVASRPDDIIGAIYIYNRQGAVWSLQIKVQGSDCVAYVCQLGGSVAIDGIGTTILAGASGARINNNTQQGAVYVFTRTNGTWSQSQKLTASDGVTDDLFGRAVAISSDGSAALIGAPGKSTYTGAAYFYVKTGSTWVENKTFGFSQLFQSFGSALALSSNGSVALIASLGSTKTVYIYEALGTGWSAGYALSAPLGDDYGYSVALTSNGDGVFVGSRRESAGVDTHEGAAYIFARVGSSWAMRPRVTSSDGQVEDWFGNSVCMNGDGSVMLAGTRAVNRPVFVFSPSPFDPSPMPTATITPSRGPTRSISSTITVSSSRTPSATITASATRTAFFSGTPSSSMTMTVSATQISFCDVASRLCETQILSYNNGTAFGQAVALSADGLTAVIGAPGSRYYTQRAYAFSLLYGRPQLSAIFASVYSAASTVDFAAAVAVSSNGSYIAVGSPSEPAVYVYVRQGSSWGNRVILSAPLCGSGCDLGTSVAIDGTGQTIVAGAPSSDYVGPLSGVVVVFVRTGSTWAEQQRLYRPQAGTNDRFGTAVAISSDSETLVVGSPGTNNSRGVVYLFKRGSGSWTRTHTFQVSLEPYATFGLSVALNYDGTVALIGSWTNHAYVFDFVEGTWNYIATLSGRSDDGFGRSVSLNDMGNVAVVGSEEPQWIKSGAAYMFIRTTGGWVERSRAVNSDSTPADRFGKAVSLDATGELLLVGLSAADRPAYLYRQLDITASTTTTATPTSSVTITSTSSASTTMSRSFTPSFTCSISFTATASRTASGTPTVSVTDSRTPSATASPRTPTPSGTQLYTLSPTVSASKLPWVQPTGTPTKTASGGWHLPSSWFTSFPTLQSGYQQTTSVQTSGSFAGRVIGGLAAGLAGISIVIAVVMYVVARGSIRIPRPTEVASWEIRSPGPSHRTPFRAPSRPNEGDNVSLTLYRPSPLRD